MTVSLGTVIYSAVKPIFKIYFIIGLGFFLAKRNILTVTTCRDISDTVVTAIMPCLIFNNVVTNLKSSDIKFLGIIFFTGTLLFSIGCALAFAISVVTRSPKKWLGGIISVGLFPNISDLPIAYLQTLSSSGAIFTPEEGNLGVAYVCIFLASQVFYQFSLGLYRLIEWDFRDELDGKDASSHEEDSVGSSEDTKGSPAHSKIVPVDTVEPSGGAAPITTSSGSAANNHAATTTAAAVTVPEVADAGSSNTSISSSNTSIVSEKSDLDPLAPALIHQRRPPLTSKLTSDEEKAQHLAFLNQKKSSLSRVASNRTSISSGASFNSHHTTGQGSVASNYLSLHLTTTNDLRHQKSQDIKDVINEYSQFDELKLIRSQTSASRAPVTHQDDQHRIVVSLPGDDDDDEAAAAAAAAAVSQVPSAVSIGAPSIVSSVQPFGKRFKAHALRTLKNFLAPNSVSLIVSIIIAMSPPLKALFVVTSNFKSMPNAPDGNPPLSFVIDFASYVGAASVPLGLLLLGATISRLQVKKMPEGFWKTALAITLMRLVLMPIVGVGLTTGFYKGGWYGEDKLVRFVSVIEFGLPSATALVYFTAFYTNPNSEEHLQMDCLAVCLIFQYCVLFITLPFLVTFTLKVSLGF